MSEKHKISDDDGINGKGNNKKLRRSDTILKKSSKNAESDFSPTSDTNIEQVVQNANELNLPVSESKQFHKHPLVTEAARIIENERKLKNQQANENSQLPENQPVAKNSQAPDGSQVPEKLKREETVAFTIADKTISIFGERPVSFV